MSNKPNQNRRQIAVALRNSYLCMAMFDAVGRELNISNRSEIPPAMARAEIRLKEFWLTGEISYLDIKDITSVASQAAHEIWNPESSSIIQSLAVKAVNDDARAWQHDALLEGTPYVMDPGAIDPIDEKLFAAIDGLKHEFHRGSDRLAAMDHKGISAAVQAFEELNKLMTEAQNKLKVASQSHQNLPGLSVPFANGASVGAWLKSIAVQQALPPANVVEPIIAAAHKGAISADAISRAADQWDALLNAPESDWSLKAITALVGLINQDRLKEKGVTSAEKLIELMAEATQQQPERSEEYQGLLHKVSAGRRINDQIAKARAVEQTIDQAVKMLKTAIASSASIRPSEAHNPKTRGELELAGKLDELRDSLIKRMEHLPEEFDEIIGDIVDLDFHLAAEEEEEQVFSVRMG